MNISAVKYIAGFAASVGVGTVIGNAIKTTSPVVGGPLGKVATYVGSFVLVGMAGKAASHYTDEQIDEAIAWYNKNFKDK